MGRKSSSKPPSGPSTGEAKSGFSPLLMIVAVLAVVAIGFFALQSKDDAATPPAADAAAQAKPANEPSPEIVEAARAAAALGPHTQENLPPIPFAAYAPPRPVEVVTAAYEFAAEHPEVLSYVPCFCGCQQGGHRGNADCFVKSRAANGDVIAWDEHGVECAVCIDVATRSRQMHASGASVKAIRATVEKEFAPSFPSMTPTPQPPSDANN